MNTLKRTSLLSLIYALLTSFTPLPAAKMNEASDKADLDQLVAETHKASLKLREDSLRKSIAKDTVCLFHAKSRLPLRRAVAKRSQSEVVLTFLSSCVGETCREIQDLDEHTYAAVRIKGEMGNSHEPRRVLKTI